MAQNDFFNPLFSISPFLFALIILIFGWGGLFLQAIKTKSLSTFLRHPAFMIGDLLILPIIGFLMSIFYRGIAIPVEELLSTKWNYFTAIISLGIVSFTFYRSIFIKRTTSFNIFSLLHFFFAWFMAYIIITFFSKGLWQLLFGGGGLFLWILWLLVFVGVLSHISLGVLWPKKFPRL